MRIAFDVKGTIEGPKKQYIIELLRILKEKGHEVLVWSNSGTYAYHAVTDNNLDCPFMTKFTFGESEFHGGPMDLCIDDDSSQEWLGSKRFIWVHNVPEFMDGIRLLAESISNEKWHETRCQDSRWASKTL